MQKQIMETLKECRYSVLSHDDDLDRVYRLRYDCYRAEQSIPMNTSGIMHDAFDDTPNCVHVAVEMNDMFIAAVRLHLVSSLEYPSPTMEVFPEINYSVEAGHTLLDPTRFVVHPAARKMRLPVHYLALRIPFLATDFYDTDIALAPVRTEHSAFYLKYLGYEHCGEPRLYPGLKKPVGLLTANVRKHRAEILEKYPFFGRIKELPQSDIDFPSLAGVYTPSTGRVSRAA
ncbi:GNAT family N-acetyltransferase [Maritimibacter sp. DP1N21-5]|uniref:N-acyl amino acid synthase FeeM domain-containing protein n=1 Tax=Maritimibacter sp. DP1N21-5 TaxID=2836867 RepID=UPI001C465463|nr:GNAT family N-acetyltransferase [Maritimibacter sp. DP1N21-5]MBV7407489.1 GNAT family N-acetyltransferase [Maritimibacter sp. DP1N21-5]